LGVDAIQEFSVLTSNYSAEYGKTSGGVVNAITRSGTNGFHGSVYEFLRNSALDARNFFDGPKIPPFRRNQFGGAIGGPILKNRTFFFADFEAIRQSKGISTVTIVPSNNARNGMIHDSNGNPITVTVDPSAAKYLTFWHAPNGALIGNGDTAFFTFAGQQVVNENFVTTRLDHKLSDKDSLSGTYLFDRTPYTSPDGLNNVLLGSVTSRQIVAVEESHMFSPSFVNSVRFGWNHVYADNDLSVGAINPAAADPSLAAQPGRVATQVSIGGGITSFTGGLGGNPTYYYRWNSFQVYDDASLTRRTHTIKFGGGVERMPLQLTALSNPNGVFQFSTLQNFLRNVPRRYNSGLASTLTPRDLRQTLFGLYVQDDWRLLRNLTLNLGLRYEMSTVPTEVHGKLSNLLAQF
jgi:hypothetical protein